MNCTNCNEILSKEDFFCSNCGKLLKIKCPRCATVNNKSICSKCKLPLILKCKQCGRKNPITLKECKSCNALLSDNAQLGEFTLQQFAIICIEFENISSIEKKLGNTFDGFLQGILKFIKYETAKLNAFFEMNKDGLVVLKFSKSNSFYESGKEAINLSIKIAKFFEKINNNLKSIDVPPLRLKIGISVSSAHDRRALARTERSLQVNNEISIIVNHQIYKYTSGKYCFENIVNVYVDNELTPLYQLIWDSVEEEEIAAKETPFTEDDEFIQEEVLPKIKFSAKTGISKLVKPFKLNDEIENVINMKQGAFIDVLGEIHTGQLSNITSDKILKSKNIYHFDCTKHHGFTPFKLIRDILCKLIDFRDSLPVKEKQLNILRQKLAYILNDYSELENLILLNPLSNLNHDELRYKLFKQFQIFLTNFCSNNQLIILINNFENIDQGSFDCIKQLIENGILTKNIVFIASSPYKKRLSKRISSVISLNNYYKFIVTEETKNSLKKYIESKVDDFENDYILNKILENSNGSVFYIDQSLNYLVESEYLIAKGDYLKVTSAKIIPLSEDINELIKRRIMGLEKYPYLYNSYMKLLMLGSEIDYSTASILVIKSNSENILNQLESMQLIETDHSNHIRLKDYNIVYDAVFDKMSNEKKEKLARQIFEELQLDGNTIQPLNTKLLSFFNLKATVKNLNLWADKALMLGDIACFIECMEEVLKLTELGINDKDTGNIQTLKSLKLDIYEKLGELSYELYPDSAFKFLSYTLNNLNSLIHKDKFIKFCTIMVKCCNLTGNYDEALLYLGKIITSVSLDVFNINSDKFNIKYYLLNYIRISALFNVGKPLQCVEVCTEFISTLNILKDKQAYNEKFTPDFIKELQADAALYMIKSKFLLLNQDIDSSIDDISKYLTDPSLVEIAKLLNSAIKGANNTEYIKIQELYKNNHLSKDAQILVCIVNFICHMQLNLWNNVPDIAFKGRLLAEKQNDFQLWYFFELIIGLVYQQNNNYKRAKSIYKDVLTNATEKCLLNIMLMSWYLLSKAELFDNNIESALEIASNANIHIERGQEISKLFVMYFKYLLAVVLANTQDFENSIICSKLALSITETNSLEYNKIVISLLIYQIFDHVSKNDKEKADFYEEDFNKLKNNLSKAVKKLNNEFLTNRYNQTKSSSISG